MFYYLCWTIIIPQVVSSSKEHLMMRKNSNRFVMWCVVYTSFPFSINKPSQHWFLKPTLPSVGKSWWPVQPCQWISRHETSLSWLQWSRGPQTHHSKWAGHSAGPCQHPREQCCHANYRKPGTGICLTIHCMWLTDANESCCVCFLGSLFRCVPDPCRDPHNKWPV